jgi:hypothetical protein
MANNEFMDQVTVKNFASEMEAELARNMLLAYGVKSFVQLKGVHSGGITDSRFGADLMVLAKDIEKAKELLG